MTNPSKNTQRLDGALVEAARFPSRARAQAAIKAGLVRINGAIAAKPSQTIRDDDVIDVEGDIHPYVSRGGMKLEAALKAFQIDPSGMTCLDLGASTGGFCDLLLRQSARKIYAVDVGTGQLHPSILDDARVVNLEKTHARDLSFALIPDEINLIVCDVSFISLKKALPPALALTAREALLVALVKPQFEVGPERIGKGGIVKPGHAYAEGVAEDMAAWVDQQHGWRSQGFIDSPITGGDGNREFLLAASKTE